MAIATRDRLAGPTAPRELAVPGENKTPPVVMWAVLGGAVLVFLAYLLIAWVSGPYFKQVPQGPSETPTWMHVELIGWQVLSLPVALYLIYRFVIRPWRRERRIGVDGLLTIAFATLWVQDPWSSAVDHWFVYNTSMVNFGSWTHSLPWWTSYGQPGSMTSEPILFTPAAYVYIMLLAAALGCWVMRRAKARWPQISTAQLVLLCFAFMCVFDVVLEGIVWLPLGVFEYPGGHWALFPNSWHKYPLNEMLTIGAIFTGMSCLRFFTNDRGQMWVERGAESIRGGTGRRTAMRALATVAAVQVIMFLGYNVPNTMVGATSTAWPKSLQEKSYFTNFLCGEGTNRLCPGPGIAHIRDGSSYVGANGKVVRPSASDEPPGHTPAGIVPFDRGKPGGAR